MIVIVILGVTFLAGVLFGVLAVLRLGISREDRDGSLRQRPPTLAAAAARRLTGVWVGPHDSADRAARARPRQTGRRDERS